MFRGTSQHTIDQKGRVSVPAKFRDKILGTGQATVFMTRSLYSPCIEGYPAEEWQRKEEEYLRLKLDQRLSPQQIVVVENVFIANAEPCDLDDQGRVLIPPAFRADLGREVVFSGALEKFRVWSRDAWETAQAEAEIALKTQPKILEGLPF